MSKIWSWTERIGQDVQGSWPRPVRSTPAIPQRAYKDRRKPRKISFGIAEASTEILTRHHRNTNQNRYRVSQFTRRSYILNIADPHCRNSETDTHSRYDTLCAYYALIGSSKDYALLSKIKWSRLASRCCVQLKGLLQTRSSPVRTAEIWTRYSPIRNCATSLTEMSSLPGDLNL